MNTLNKSLISGLAAAVLAGLYSQTAFATDISATATANVLAPLAISQTAQMNFGDVAGDGTTATTVLLSVLGATSSGNGAYTGGTPAAGAFAVTGSGTLAYTISLPTVAVTLTNAALDTVSVDSFIDSKGGSSALVAGADSFTVGATLSLGIAQPAGTYNGTYDVTVEYQ